MNPLTAARGRRESALALSHDGCEPRLQAKEVATEALKRGAGV